MSPVEEGNGSILEAEVEALVNTVNTAGVMGKGLALAFKQAFPGNFRAYREAFEAGQLRPGKVLVWERPPDLFSSRLVVVNFPTKRHWRAKSRMDDIEAGLEDLLRVVEQRDIASIAVPALGCGQGGLRWEDVRPRVIGAFSRALGVRLVLFGPEHHSFEDP